MSFRDTEFTLSGGFTGNYLEDELSKLCRGSYVALGDRRLCQIALPAPLRQCLASSAARFGANRTRFAIAASPSLVVHPA